MRKLLNVIIVGQFVMITIWYHLGQLCLLPLKSLPLLSLLPLVPQGSGNRIYSRVEDHLSYRFTSLVTWWCECVMGLRVSITKNVGREIRDQTIVLANHVAYADWFAMFFLGFYAGRKNGQLRWIVKEDVLRLPILGWCMRCRDFIGIKRNFKDDFSALKHGILRYLKHKLNFWLVIYPEGTFVDGTGNHDKIVREAQEFCDREHIPQMTHVLVPRYKGFDTISKTLEEQKADVTDRPVLNVTIAFRGKGSNSNENDPSFDSTLPLIRKDRHLPNPIHLLTGTGPKELHIHCEVAKRDGRETKKWLYDIWQSKDKLLREFEVTGKFPDCGVDVVDKNNYSIWQPCVFFLFGLFNGWLVISLLSWLFSLLIVIFTHPVVGLISCLLTLMTLVYGRKKIRQWVAGKV